MSLLDPKVIVLAAVLIVIAAVLVWLFSSTEFSTRAAVPRGMKLTASARVIQMITRTAW